MRNTYRNLITADEKNRQHNDNHLIKVEMWNYSVYIGYICTTVNHIE